MAADNLPSLGKETLQDASLQNISDGHNLARSLADSLGDSDNSVSDRIWDINQKTFYLRNNQLVAGYLQGSNTKLEEKLDVVPIEPHAAFLGIHGGKMCLACVKSGDEIRLQLEAVNITDLCKDKDRDKRFTFLLSDSGPTTSFESAAFPGWFLCTALEADRPVSLTNTTKEAMTVTRFYFQKD